MAVIPDAVGTGELAAFLKITPRQLQKLVTQGVLPKASRGEYPFAECVRAYFGRKIERELERRPERDTLRERREQEIAQRIAIRDRMLIGQAEAQAVLDDVCGLFLGAVSGLPAQITRDHGEKKRIEGICDTVRRRLIDRFAKTTGALRSGGAVGDAEPEDDA